MEKIGIYIHIPFCTAKCSYCDFASFSASEEVQRRYVSSLKKEIALRCSELKNLVKADSIGKNIENSVIFSGCDGVKYDAANKIPESSEMLEFFEDENATRNDDKSQRKQALDSCAGANNSKSLITVNINKNVSKNKSKCSMESENSDEKLHIDTVFIGGGTPSTLYRGGLSEIIAELRQHFSFTPYEFTVEANPESVTLDFVKECKQIGANRISLGLQTAAAHLLKNLRRHTFADFARAVKIIRMQGIENINADIMLGLQDQTNVDIKDTLVRLMKLKIPHISAYSLKVEQGTPLFSSGYSPDDDTLAAHYEIVCGILMGKKSNASENNVKNDSVSLSNTASGYKTGSLNFEFEKTKQSFCDKEYGNYIRYEVSNFAQNGYECRHNQKYWTLQTYLGLGLSASSYYNEKRTTNTRDFLAYIDGNYDDFSEDARPNFLAEYVMLGLRTSQGISKSFLENQGLCIKNNPSFQKFFKSGVLISDGDKIIINPDYYYVMNSILSELI